MDKFKVKKADVIIAVAVLCAAALVLLCFNIFAGSGSAAVIEQNGTVIAELPLDENAVFEVKDGGRVTNVVEVKDGAVSVTKADCPAKITGRSASRVRVLSACRTRSLSPCAATAEKWTVLRDE